MPERSGYKPGVPCWIDIGTDIDAGTAFYSALFGWEAQSAGPVEETGGYGMFLKNGKVVAGYGPQQQQGPPFWSTYIAVSDADAVAKRVEAGGGNVVVPPMDVMTAGRMAVFQDPFGAFFSVWQAGEHTGAQLVNEPGSFTWNELDTRDVEGSKAFYGSVFDWDSVTNDEGGMSYTEFKIGGDSIAGMMPMPPMVPAEVPPYWLTYFAVDDADAIVAKTQELGGSVRSPIIDLPIGRFCVLADPQGATFAVIKMAEAPA